MLLCLLKEMDFGVLEWAVLGNVILLLVLLVVLFYTICRLRKATLKNKLEETLPYSDTTDLVPQRYSTLCGLKTGNTRQNGISVLSSSSGHMENFHAIAKSNRMNNFVLEKGSANGAVSTATPIIAMSPTSGPPAYFSATLPLPSKKKAGGAAALTPIKVPMHWTPPPPYWIALPSSIPHPSTTFQYVGPYTTLPAVLKKHQRCRHEHHILRNNGYHHHQTNHHNHHANHHHSSSNSTNPSGNGGRRAIDSSSPHHCMVVHNCGKKQVHMQEDI